MEQAQVTKTYGKAQTVSMKQRFVQDVEPLISDLGEKRRDSVAMHLSRRAMQPPKATKAAKAAAPAKAMKAMKAARGRK